MGNHEPVLRKYFREYLKQIQKVSDTTVYNYLRGLKAISEFLQSRNLIKKDIYEIKDMEQLDEIREILEKDREFQKKNQVGHRMYSAGFNNYYRFAEGSDFLQYTDKIQNLDFPVVKEEAAQYETTTKAWKRSDILRQQVIEAAGFCCELGHDHQSFIAERTHKPYMEAHHAIPLHLQDKFENSLDVYANIICLCPICHRRIHYGLKNDKHNMLDEIYEKRIGRMEKCGILLSKTEFERVMD